MKENLINDKDQAFLSKTLATIDTQSPIEIDLDDTAFTGPDLEKLAAFYDEMGFVQFKNALGGEAVPQDFDVAYTEPSQVTEDHFSSDDFFYLEILGENYHMEPIIGFAWGMTSRFMRLQILTYSNQTPSRQLFLKLLISTISSEVRSF